MKFNLYLSEILMVATISSLILVYLSWRRRQLPIAKSYGLGVLAGAFYTLGYAFELISDDLKDILFWLKFEYIGIPFAPTLWMIMVLQYTGRQAYIRKWTIAILMIVPVSTLAAVHTNDWHHLFYRSVSIGSSEGVPLVVLNHGPLFYLHVVYSFFFFFLGMGLLIHMYFTAPSRMKKQIIFMMIGSCGPFGSSLMYVTGVLKTPIDVSPFGFVISGVFYLLGIYQFDMLKLSPLAQQKVFDSIQDAVIVFDLDDNISEYNRSASRMIKGLYNRNGIGQPAAMLFSSYPTLLHTILQEPLSENRILFGDEDNDRIYQAQMLYIYDNRSRPSGKMLLLRDTTDAVRSEERLINNATQLQELNTFKDELFSVVAHDIRDPLAILLNLMEILEEELPAGDADHEEIVHEMGQQLRKTLTLAENLLGWFRKHQGGMILSPDTYDLFDAVQMSLHLLRIRSEGKGIVMVSEVPPNTWVYADKEMLNLIVRNLLSNAVKFTDTGGSITVRAERSDGKMIVAISDTGVGVREDLAQTLLQSEHSASTAGTAGEQGIGLGLAICREFVRLNGGEIWFDSNPAQGSTFYFTVPLPSEVPNINSNIAVASYGRRAAE
ncbi:histidine kinase N-terminal 7TM domain-containing protein [Paenibacillus sp. GCM10012306]|uniref:sensor histidine kinase n=1 Tax=Paenibacillus sp. GCM10012306 TaxID=3317342 RepID=UPI00360D4B7D